MIEAAPAGTRTVDFRQRMAGRKIATDPVQRPQHTTPPRAAEVVP
jgi:hypothetical protein